jgi:hypothetical protein
MRGHTIFYSTHKRMVCFTIQLYFLKKGFNPGERYDFSKLESYKNFLIILKLLSVCDHHINI